jgi:hypothetical protein
MTTYAPHGSALLAILFDNIGELRASFLPADKRRSLEAIVKTTGGRYLWAPASLAEDDGASVVKPADVAADSGGRWIEQAGGGGTPSDTVVSETIAGQSPSAGTSDEFSRGDHTHGTPAGGGVGGNSWFPGGW